MISIKDRKTIRKYSDKEVPNSLLHQLLTEAERTPTMGNLQLYSVVVTRSEQKHLLCLPFVRISDAPPLGPTTGKRLQVTTTFCHF